jgi:hypothetical protein
MLPKKNRVDKNGINLIFKEGKFISSPLFTFKFILNNKSISPRISFIAPISIAKLAVKRNSLRRKGYLALETYIKAFPSNILGAFVFKKIEDDVLKIENEIKNILNKIN